MFERYRIKMTGVTPLLMHHDNLAWADRMQAWRMDPANKGASTPGDDRTPAFRWIGNLYLEAGHAAMFSDNLMTLIREGGQKCPTGKGQQTYKAITQSGIVVDQAAWPITINGAEVPVTDDDIEMLMQEPDFMKHCDFAKSRGFELFVKRAKIERAKHVRVRPRFDRWECEGTLTVLDERITRPVLENIFTFAGSLAGIGDWRPSSPKFPGPFGKFEAKIKSEGR